MLQNAYAVAVHNGIFVVIIQQHTHDGRFRHEGADSRRNFFIFRAAGSLIVQPGAIEAVHAQHLGANVRRRPHGGVQRQIAALGVAAGVEPFKLPGGGRQKFHRVGLGGHRRLKAHVKVLLPPHHGGIGAAKGRHSRPFVQLEQCGGKLLFPGRVEMIGELLHLHPAEALALRRCLPQLAALLFSVVTESRVRRIQFRRQLRQCSGRESARHPFQGAVGQSGEDQQVNGVDGSAFKTQVAAPVQIIKHESQPPVFSVLKGPSVLLL